jgi:hypothetical protein
LSVGTGSIDSMVWPATARKRNRRWIEARPTMLDLTRCHCCGVCGPRIAQNRARSHSVSSTGRWKSTGSG